MSREGKPYDVGYGKPPVASRFQKGRSGNPRGRAKGSKNLAQLIEQELDRKITVTENGQRRTITKREGIAKQLVNKAVAGDPKAIPFLVEGRHGEVETDRVGAPAAWNTEEDHKVVLTLLKRLRGDSDAGEGGA
jgi:hypothetical protein